MAIGVMNWVWTYSRSRHGARLVLLAIADCASGDGSNAWPSVAELKRKAGLGERAVQTALADLVKLGELEIGYNAGPKGCNRYRVLMAVHTPAESAPPQNLHPPADNAPPQDLRGLESAQANGQTPADIAPPAESAPPQISTDTPAESAPVTVKEPKPKNSPAESSSGPRKRGARIPDDFTVTPEMVTWARRRCPNVDGRTETEKFINHWSNKPGRDALKLDWTKAWQNWMLTAEQQAPRGRAAPARSNGSVNPRDEWKLNRA